jgi:hypothetical protein
MPAMAGTHASFLKHNQAVHQLPHDRMLKLAWIPAVHAEHGFAMTPG